MAVQGVHYAGYFTLNQVYHHSALGESNGEINFSVILV